MRNLSCLLLLTITAIGCQGRYSGFPDYTRTDAIEKEREIAKEDVVAATAELKVGMTEKEVMDLLLRYNVGIGIGGENGKEHWEWIYLIHGVLVDVKYDGIKGPEKDKVVEFKIRSFHGWNGVRD